jgi:ubiquitin C-terminal hydrolase
VIKRLKQHPDVFAMGLVWSTPDPSQQEIVDMLNVVAPEIQLGQIFAPHECKTRHVLRGMICYYGKHYDAYFYSQSRKTWMVFDDITVKSV